MGSLFWRIFLAFWIATSVIVISSVYLSFRAADRASSAVEDGPRHLVGDARRILRNDGEQALKRWLKDRKDSGPRLLIIDPDGNELLGRRLGPASRRWLERQNRQGRKEFRLEDRNGAMYRAVLGPPPLRVGPLHFESSRTAIGIMALIVSALLSLLLSRYIVRPIRQVDRAARDLTHGNLRARANLNSGGSEIVDLGQRFDIMASQVESLLSSQRELLRNVSHELRSPLARLRLALELGRSNETRVESAFQRIEHETLVLDQLISQILRLSRVTDPAAEFRTETVNLGALIKEVVADASYEAAPRDILVQQNADDLELFVSAPEELLHSAVENVVRNAIRYSDDGGKVVLTLSTHAGNAILVVSDTGPGVPEEYLGAIFEPFFRTQTARARNNGGEGIGLAITRAVIERLGGNVSASNRESAGLDVTISLPLTESDSESER